MTITNRDLSAVFNNATHQPAAHVVKHAAALELLHELIRDFRAEVIVDPNKTTMDGFTADHVYNAARKLADLVSANTTPRDYTCAQCQKEITSAHHPYYPICLKCWSENRQTERAKRGEI